jgi:hypothetical protein
MSEDIMNIRGRHAGLEGDYQTTELEPIDDSPIPFTDEQALEVHHADLDTDPFADDLSEQLAARAPRRYYTRATVVLAGLVLLAGGFLAGAQVQKNFGTPASGAGRSNGGNNANLANGFGGGRNGTGGFTGGGFTGGNGAGPGRGAAPTTGTVKLVDGTTVYVQTADGGVVTVRTNGSTAVQVAQPGKLTDLTPGAQVTVQGSAAADGTVTATSVTTSR